MSLPLSSPISIVSTPPSVTVFRGFPFYLPLLLVKRHWSVPCLMNLLQFHHARRTFPWIFYLYRETKFKSQTTIYETHRLLGCHFGCRLWSPFWCGWRGRDLGSDGAIIVGHVSWDFTYFHKTNRSIHFVATSYGYNIRVWFCHEYFLSNSHFLSLSVNQHIFNKWVDPRPFNELSLFWLGPAPILRFPIGI